MSKHTGIFAVSLKLEAIGAYRVQEINVSSDPLVGPCSGEQFMERGGQGAGLEITTWWQQIEVQSWTHSESFRMSSRTQTLTLCPVAKTLKFKIASRGESCKVAFSSAYLLLTYPFIKSPTPFTLLSHKLCGMQWNMIQKMTTHSLLSWYLVLVYAGAPQ